MMESINISFVMIYGTSTAIYPWLEGGILMLIFTYVCINRMTSSRN